MEEDELHKKSMKQLDEEKAEKMKWLYSEKILLCRGQNVSKMSTREIVGNIAWAKRELAKKESASNKAWVEILEQELKKHQEMRS